VKRFFLVLAQVFSLSAVAPAQKKRPRPRPGPPAAQPASLRSDSATEIKNKVLANGLEIIVVEDHSVPLVTIELAARNGSFTEPPEFNGLSHLYEHMFFKANRAIANQENYLKEIGLMGIAYNGQTREEVVNYYFTTTAPYIETAMRFMRDATRYPLFDEEEFSREKQVVIGEIDRNESNPYYYLDVEVKTRLFYKYPSRKNPLGNRETVGNATTAMMRTIQNRYYIPRNLALVVTGDVSPENVYRLAEELYGDWGVGKDSGNEDPFIKFPLVEHPPLPKSEGVIVQQPIQNVIFNIGWHGPSVGKDNAATYAADVFSFIVNQPNSRFQRALADTGLVQGAGLNYYTQRNVGPITILAQTSPEKAKAALRAVYAEVARFNDPNYFTDEQLENAKTLLAADDLYGREKLSEYAHTLSFWWSSTGIEYFRGYQSNLRAITRADISRYIKTYIQDKPHVGVVMLSSGAQRQIQITPEDLIGK
jgi:zinc protease